MLEKNVRQRTKQLPSMEARSHCPSSLPPGFSNKGDIEKILVDGTDIHSGPSDESSQELYE